jgi:hypothetical protein
VAPKCAGSNAPGLRRPDPPRCCTDLQRLTGRCSRSFGFPAPPAPFSPFDVDPGVFQRPAHRSVALPVGSPLLALRSPSRTSRATLDGPPEPPATDRSLGSSILPWGCPPLRRSQLAESTSRKPWRLQPKLPCPGLPRRGVPPPLRAAFAVSHDLDGLRLCEPCDLFQPLTPMGLGSRLPDPCPFTSATRTDPSGPRG